MKSRFYAAIAVVLLVFALGLARGLFVPAPAKPVPPPPRSNAVQIFGVEREVDSAKHDLKIALANGSEEDAHVADDAVISVNGTEGETFTDIQPDTVVEVFGTRDPSTLVITAETVRTTDTQNIYVSSPDADGTVTSPVIVEGFSRTFENVVNWRVRDAEGTEQASGSAIAVADPTESFSIFHAEIFLPSLDKKDFSLEVFDLSAKDGAENDLVSLPLHLLSTSMTTLNAYFPDAKQNTTHACDVVFPLTRTVAETSAAARASLRELVNGLSDDELARGFTSALPVGFAVNSVALSGGDVTVDVNDLVTRGTLCQQKTIRAQIEQTLLQFPTIGNVTITIDGDPKRIFKP